MDQWRTSYSKNASIPRQQCLALPLRSIHVGLCESSHDRQLALGKQPRQIFARDLPLCEAARRHHCAWFLAFASSVPGCHQQNKSHQKSQLLLAISHTTNGPRIKSSLSAVPQNECG